MPGDSLCRCLQVVHDNPHPHMAQVLGLCTDAPDGQVRLVMRLYAKGSLEDALKLGKVKVGGAAEQPMWA
jgi:hypothetical protein